MRLWFKERTNGATSMHEVPVLERSFDPNHRRLIYFPGKAITDYQAGRHLAGCMKPLEAKIVTSGTDSFRRDLFLYTYESPLHCLFHRKRHYLTQPEHFIFEGETAARKVLLPMLLEPGERFEMLPPQVLKERLSSVTLVGHSYGSVVMQHAVKFIAHYLYQHGWDMATVADCMKELVTISVANTARLDMPAVPATTMVFTAANDNTARAILADAMAHRDTDDLDERDALERSLKGRSLEALCGYDETRVPDDKVKIRPLPSGYLIRAHGRKSAQLLDERTGLLSDDALLHDDQSFFDHPKIGRILSNVVNNAMARSVDIGDGHRLLLAKNNQPERLAGASRQAETPRL